jgi:hypothetical protein
MASSIVISAQRVVTMATSAQRVEGSSMFAHLTLGVARQAQHGFEVEVYGADLIIIPFDSSGRRCQGRGRDAKGRAGGGTRARARTLTRAHVHARTHARAHTQLNAAAGISIHHTQTQTQTRARARARARRCVGEVAVVDCTTVL